MKWEVDETKELLQTPTDWDIADGLYVKVSEKI